MPALTTDTRSPYAACIRRENTSGQRSSPLSVDAVPSVIESPNAQITRVSAGAITSTASRKYHDVVVNGKALSSLRRCARRRRAAEVGRLQRLRVPRHRAARAGDVETDRELAPVRRAPARDA